MLISPAKTSKDFVGLRSHSQGFSLIEVLVVLLLMGLIFTALPLGQESNRALLEEGLDDLDRAMRFASDESALRNNLVRLYINTEKSPALFSVEYTEDPDTLIPEIKDLKKLTLSETEEEREKLSRFNKKFTPVTEFEEEKNALDENLEVIGLFQGEDNRLIIGEDVSIFFHPTGEKDSGILFLSTNEEIGALFFDSMSEKTTTVFRSYPPGSEDNLPNAQEVIMQELTDAWRSTP